MKRTETKYGAEARESLKSGVDQVANAVKHTLGARGRNAVYKQYNAPVVTNDGISIAWQIKPKDEYEYLGAELVKQASEETNYEAGDGTTSTAIVAQALVERGLEEVEDGYNPMVLRREMEDAQKLAIAKLEELKRDDFDLFDVAKVSVENEEVARIVADVVEEVGTDGVVLVEESPGTEIKVETVRGYAYPKGFFSPYMATNNNGEAILEEVPILIVEGTLSLNTELVGLAGELAEKGEKKLVVIADKVEGDLLKTIVMNKAQGYFTVIATGRPDSVEGMEDLAALVGAEAVTQVKDIKDFKAEHCGRAQKAIITKDRTIIVGEENDRVAKRIEEVTNALENSDGKYGEVEDLRDRLARLVGGIAKIKVGAATAAEQTYLKMKIDDAVGATRAAMAEGVVAGGGTTYRDIARALDGKTKGEQLLAHSLSQPFLQLMKNAGIEDYDSTKCYDVYTGEEIDDMCKAGIIDPAKVIRCVIKNAVSTAKTLLTTEVAVIELPEADSKERGQN